MVSVNSLRCLCSIHTYSKYHFVCMYIYVHVPLLQEPTGEWKLTSRGASAGEPPWSLHGPALPAAASWRPLCPCSHHQPLWKGRDTNTALDVLTVQGSFVVPDNFYNFIFCIHLPHPTSKSQVLPGLGSPTRLFLTSLTSPHPPLSTLSWSPPPALPHCLFPPSLTIFSTSQWQILVGAPIPWQRTSPLWSLIFLWPSRTPVSLRIATHWLWVTILCSYVILTYACKAFI